jgi:hypothetical protein
LYLIGDKAGVDVKPHDLRHTYVHAAGYNAQPGASICQWHWMRLASRRGMGMSDDDDVFALTGQPGPCGSGGDVEMNLKDRIIELLLAAFDRFMDWRSSGMWTLIHELDPEYHKSKEGW